MVAASPALPNTIANLVMLCGHHHNEMHHRGWTITGTTDGQLAFHPPGPESMPPTDDGDLERVLARLEDQAHMYGPMRIEPHRNRFDLGYAVSNFLEAMIYRRTAAAAAAAMNGGPRIRDAPARFRGIVWVSPPVAPGNRSEAVRAYVSGRGR